MSRMLSKMNLISTVQQLPKEDIETIQGYVEMIEEENQELKKQLEDTNEELELVRCDLHNRTSERDSYYRNIEIIENQQKEFIKYLEEEISKWHYNYDSNTYEYELEEPPAEELLVSALSKYQEIIGQQDGQQSGQV